MDLEVIGLPAPQGSKSAYVLPGTNRAVVVDGKGPGRLALDSWRKAVADACRAYLERLPAPPITGPIAVTIRFRFPTVKSDPYRCWHSTKPDLDKLVRSTFDAMKHGGLIADDSAIAKVSAVKRYVNASETSGASITVESLASEEAEMRESRKQRAANARKALPNPLQEQLLG